MNGIGSSAKSCICIQHDRLGASLNAITASRPCPLDVLLAEALVSEDVDDMEAAE
jgi:hypothetical protein